MIHIFEQYPEKMKLSNLSHNPNAIQLLEKTPDKINWHHLSQNPAIFTYDYDAMRESHKDLKQELMQSAWHPSRIQKWLEAGLDLEDI